MDSKTSNIIKKLNKILSKSVPIPNKIVVNALIKQKFQKLCVILLRFIILYYI